MSTTRLAVISTRLTPGACGIGAHSVLLRKYWPDAQKPVEFLVVEGANGVSVLPDGDRATEFGGSASSLARELDRIGSADVLLHYAGRAYHRLGFPFWLPGVLKRWKQKFAGARVMVLFHEVPGDDLPITSRHHWLNRLNRRVVRQLGALADFVVTNTDAHAAQLQQVTRRSDVHLVPIGSNIELAPGEQQPVRCATEFVIFGLPFGRLQVVQTFDTSVRRWHAAGKLTRLHIIGPSGDQFSSEADQLMSGWPQSLPLVKHGMLPSNEVSRLLQTTRCALTNVTPETWSKSGAFMACAMHRCGVVITGRPPTSAPLSYAIGADELETISDAELERRTAALAEWATSNASWPVIASRMAALLHARNGDGR